MSKRKLLKLVTEKIVKGWDDPRMPTISGFRRRGYPAEAIRDFCERIGVAKRNNMIELSLLEFCARNVLNKTSDRVMGVFNPLKVVITNYPDGQIEEMEGINNPEDETAGTRMIPFSKEIYIERDDFMEDAPKKFFRLAPGREVRLRYAYFITCQDVIKDPQTGEILELHCTYDPETRGGNAPDGRKVKGTIHWVSIEKGIKATARLYENLFTKENPEEEGDFMQVINPESLKETECFVEPHLLTCKAEDRIQFERIGYFCMDKDTTQDRLVFNRTVTLKDSWSKEQQKS
jgi:glutaminyl-tRNA synthetase